MSLGHMMLSEGSQTHTAGIVVDSIHMNHLEQANRGRTEAADARGWGGAWRMTASGREVASRGDENVLYFIKFFLNICFY